MQKVFDAFSLSGCLARKFYHYSFHLHHQKPHQSWFIGDDVSWY